MDICVVTFYVDFTREISFWNVEEKLYIRMEIFWSYIDDYQKLKQIIPSSIKDIKP